MFAKYGSLEALDGCKILLQVVGTICPPGKPHSVKKKFELFLGRPSSGGIRARSNIYDNRRALVDVEDHPDRTTINPPFWG